MKASPVSILGCGNIGTAIAKGLIRSGKYLVSDITLTRRKIEPIQSLGNSGFAITTNNVKAVNEAEIIILAVTPLQISDLLDEIAPHIKNSQLLISVVSGVPISEIQKKISDASIVRAMPNTAAALCESMVCLSADKENKAGLNKAVEMFKCIGNTLIIDEEQMASATSLGACGVAFFLRAIRAASQGGIEIGFHSDEAFTIAAQTARGAATLLLDNDSHPEAEIDQVTTPRGATIAGLNEMEHQGLSSAMIKGITTSKEKVSGLFKK